MSACRSCGATVLWTRTVAGKAMPLDPTPIDGGNVVLENGRARVVSKANPAPDGAKRYVSHHATCPQRARWRR